MGKLIKNHWARLIVLTAAAYHTGASLEAFFWPKIFWDWLTINLDPLVKPFPALQIVNIVFALAILAFEWPLAFLPRYRAFRHPSIELRLFLYPLAALLAVLLYQGTNAALYYVVGIAVYFWAYCDGEVVCPTPWTLPSKLGHPAPP